MNQSYLFESDHLGFRQVLMSDFDYILRLSTADPEAWSSDPAEIEIRIQKDIAYYKAKGYGAFLAFELDSGDFIGRAGFSDIQNGEIEVGYVVMDQYRGKGYATEMLKALLSWAKGHIKNNRIISITAVVHSASERIMQNAGMKYYKRDMVDGVDSLIYEYIL